MSAATPGSPRGWILTYTGRQFWPLSPKVEDVNIVDIAHSLSMKCRYGGFPKHFYSVAEHCVHVSFLLRPELQFQGLMHDAGEAYSPFGDIPRPVKQVLPQFVRDVNDRIDEAIAARYGLPADEHCEVRYIDASICLDEKAFLMPRHPESDTSLPEGIKPTGVMIQGWSPERAKSEFLRRFYNLTDNVTSREVFS